MDLITNDSFLKERISLSGSLMSSLPLRGQDIKHRHTSIKLSLVTRLRNKMCAEKSPSQTSYAQVLAQHEYIEPTMAKCQEAVANENRIIAKLGLENYIDWGSRTFDPQSCRLEDWGKELFENRVSASFLGSSFMTPWTRYGTNVWSLLFSGFFPKEDYFKCFSCGLCLKRAEDITVDFVTLHLFARPGCVFLKQFGNQIVWMIRAVESMYNNKPL